MLLPREVVDIILLYRRRIIFGEKCSRFAGVFSRLPERKVYRHHPLTDDFDVLVNSKLLHQMRVWPNLMEHRCRYFFRCQLCATTTDIARPCSDLCVWTERPFIYGDEQEASHTVTLRGYGGRVNRTVVETDNYFGRSLDELYFQDCSIFKDVWEYTL
jgi:hypothetical protein